MELAFASIKQEVYCCYVAMTLIEANAINSLNLDIVIMTSLDVCRPSLSCAYKLIFGMNPTSCSQCPCNYMPVSICLPCSCIPIICMYAHAHVHKPSWSTLRRKEEYNNQYNKLKCRTLSYGQCHVSTLASSLPPPPGFPHHTHLLHL